MEISTIIHADPGALRNFNADIFITTLGFEARCTNIARLYEDHACRKIALSRTDHLKAHSFKKNREYYLSNGFEIISVEKEVPDVGALLTEHRSEQIDILLDCTSMSPRWYYEFFSWFSESQDLFGKARIRIAYTMAAFNNSDQSRKVKGVKEFLEAHENSIEIGKTALILGLGHEKQVGQEIFNKIKPDLLYLFYADPPVEKQFVEQVFVNNHSLIDTTPIRNLISYPIRNGQVIYERLIDTILPLRNKYTIILIPHGPKIFSLVAMLVHLGYPDIVISYPIFKRPPTQDRIPSGEPVILDILLEGEE
jgi:hypothetical protein